jgi:hypothetical protein
MFVCGPVNVAVGRKMVNIVDLDLVPAAFALKDRHLGQSVCQI